MLKPWEKTPWHEAHFAWSTTARRGTTADPSALNSSSTFCIASCTVPDCPAIVTLRRASMPTRQVPVPPAGTPLATVVVKVKTPLASGPVSVPPLVLSMEGVVTGGVRPPKSLDGPLIASARVLSPLTLVITVPSPLGPGRVGGPGPRGRGPADSGAPARPFSCVERCGTVCAPATEIPNSAPLGTWQSVLQNASGCAPGTWFVPGAPAPVVISLGF